MAQGGGGERGGPGRGETQAGGAAKERALRFSGGDSKLRNSFVRSSTGECLAISSSMRPTASIAAKESAAPFFLRLTFPRFLVRAFFRSRTDLSIAAISEAWQC